MGEEPGPCSCPLQYVLRGVSFFTGWASASSYVTYIRGDDTWWRISQTDAIQVSLGIVRI